MAARLISAAERGPRIILENLALFFWVIFGFLQIFLQPLLVFFTYLCPVSNLEHG